MQPLKAVHLDSVIDGIEEIKSEIECDYFCLNEGLQAAHQDSMYKNIEKLDDIISKVNEVKVVIKKTKEYT